VEPNTFLEFAKVDRFSLCLTDDTEGVLKLNTPRNQEQVVLGSVGKLHWGVDFRGISIGDIHSDVVVCKGENMSEFQETPCAGIPDSGTTLISAPEWQLEILFESICDKWSRCSENYTHFMKAQQKVESVAEDFFNGSQPWDIFNVTKTQVFQMLLNDCDSWLTEENSLDKEMPELHFHIKGSEGNNQTLTLGGWAYVMEVTQEGSDDVKQEEPGSDRPGDIFLSTDAKIRQGAPTAAEADGEKIPQKVKPDPFAFGSEFPKRTCQAAFGAMDYTTSINGPVWILGTSFFYDFDVTFDLGTEPPSMTFTELNDQGCGTCKSAAPAALGQTQVSQARSRTAQPRRISGPPRKPQIDVNRPL